MDEDRSKLGSASTQREEFLMELAHQLRTPLTSIRGFASTLLAHWPDLTDEQRQSFIDRIDVRSMEMNALITRMIDLWETRNGHAPPGVQETDLGLEILRSIESLAGTLRDHDLRVEVEPGWTVLFEAGALRKVIENLLLNARNFSPSGSRITIKAQAFGNNRVVVSVQDQGVGIAPGDRERIFEKFERAENGTANPGVGIGLTIVKQLCESHGGKVWVESWPGHGSVFSFTLPLSVRVPSELS